MTTQDLMLRITGYSDRFSARPGETVRFHINAEQNERFEAQIVRLIHGDTNPDGPGYKEEEIATDLDGMHQGEHQPLHSGSYIVVPHAREMNVASFTLCALIYPTTPVTDTEGVNVGMQGLLTKFDESTGTGFGLFINDDGELTLRIGDGKGHVQTFSTGRPLFRKVWYKVAASYDAETGAVQLYQQAHVTNTNGGHGMSMLHPLEDTNDSITATASGGPAHNDAPFLLAASTAEVHSGRHICGAHFKEVVRPLELPVNTYNYNGKIERPKFLNCAASPAQIELMFASAGVEHVPNELRASLVGAWDFSANMERNAASPTVYDMSPCRLNGHGINLPVRGVPGFNWTADYMSFLHGPQEYGAIHFHDESVDDARWKTSLELRIPENFRSGCYAVRLRVNGEATAEMEDYIPFFVRPPVSGPTAKIALIMSTNSYMAYANDNLSVNSVVAQLLTGQVPLLQPGDLLLNKERGYGLGTYASYRDGWGVNISSRLRPILNMRPKYIHVLSPSLWQLNADLHLVDWLEQMNYDVDIHTDEDLQREGVGLLKQYPVVLTGHHPEYITEDMMDAYHDYQMQGGRWMYLAANGFYWVTVAHPDNPNIIEVRKGDNGARAWTINPGEYCNAFDGKHGGLWRVRGRAMAKLLGVSFTSFGLTYSSYYRPAPDADHPEAAWIMNGIDRDEPIGDFGLIGDGAAGLELDRYDLELGTPHRAFLLANSEGHSDMFVTVSEESTFNARGYYAAGTGETNPQIRADLVYYKTPNDGAVFSVGSMSWCGSLSHNNYDNNVSRIMRNTIDGFLKEGPLP
ncbi:MAG: N,N-dimethylformamidase beta subunit family domain-containing protein [Gammaproteobacteria bacterium]|jgi:N,N-dimethylformamidase